VKLAPGDLARRQIDVVIGPHGTLLGFDAVVL
jgi:hypothetical protein